MITEGIAHTRLISEGRGSNIFTIYNVGAKRGIEDIIKRITERCEGYEGDGAIIGGDFNIKIGELGDCRDDECDVTRENKDKFIGDGGKSFVDMINERGWYILNGCTEGD